MEIRGQIKLTLQDYPGKFARVFFTSGCNMRCWYCHNPSLVLSEMKESMPLLDHEQLFEDLIDSDILDGVVVTGGEPTIHKDLPEFIKKIKFIGKQVKLDTNGTNPSMVNYLIDNGLVDYVAMDIKMPLKLKKYKQITAEISQEVIFRIKESIEILNQCDIEHEFRITVVKGCHSKEDITDVRAVCKGKLILQNFNPEVILSGKLDGKEPFSVDEIQDLVQSLESYFPERITLLR